MNFDRLNTFLVAAEDLNFTQAARRLHLSQPAVSQQIRELEDELGVSLFERRGRGLLLTPAGERLRTVSQPIMRELKQMEVEMSAFKDTPQGVLRVGASNTPGIYLLPEALGRFAASETGVRVSLHVADTEAILRALHEGDVDMAVVEEEPPMGRLQGWERIPVLQDELVLISRPDHPWAKAGKITLDRLVESPFIFRTRQSETRQLIHKRLAEEGLDPEQLSVPFELGNTEGIKRSVMAGLGMGFVSCFATSLERRTGLLAEVGIENFHIPRTLWLIRPADTRLTPHLQRFCELLEGQDWLPEASSAALASR
jgi:DNA-binding transcriptional LysR family regulator